MVTYAVLASSIEVLETGLRRQQVASIIKAKHPDGATLNEGNITQALQNTASCRSRKHPADHLDYDQTTRS